MTTTYAVDFKGEQNFGEPHGLSIREDSVIDCCPAPYPPPAGISAEGNDEQ